MTKEKKQRHTSADQAHMSEDNPDEEKGTTMIDFGDIDDERKLKSKKMRVKICASYIYNYPSGTAVTRSGWLQFCLIAKDSDLHDAIKLCRHWNEFWDLNVLSIFQYFPAANWLVWKGDTIRQQLLLQVCTYPSLDSYSINTNLACGDSYLISNLHMLMNLL